MVQSCLIYQPLKEASETPQNITFTIRLQAVLVDNASAQRAQTEYGKALAFLKANDFVNASRTAGTMTHYIADLAVFGHVMGASTPWGTETHHSDYETHVNGKTGTYSSTFNSYLAYDGSLTSISAYNATVNLAYNTVFGVNSQSSCVWMDDNYNWSNATFSGRCGESLNLAVNAVADVLHTLYVDSSPAPTSHSDSKPHSNANSNRQPNNDANSHDITDTYTNHFTINNPHCSRIPSHHNHNNSIGCSSGPSGRLQKTNQKAHVRILFPLICPACSSTSGPASTSSKLDS